MISSRIAIKFFLQSALNTEKLVLSLHRWIQEQSLSGHLLIDVASYQHVSEGPKVVLVSHEANISYDDSDGMPGLIYQRKRALTGPFGEQFAKVLAAGLEACSKLETDEQLGAVKFKTDHLNLKILDKLQAPNEQATLWQIESSIQSALEKVFGAKATLEQRIDPVRPFELDIRFSSSPNMIDLIERSSVAAMG